jgi:EF hand
MQMKTMLLGVSAALAASVAVAGYAYGGGGHDRLKAADLNRDGQLSLAELRQASEGMFRDVDANRDGQITRTEAAAFHKEGVHSGKQSLRGKAAGDRLSGDADGDGAVTAAEFQAHIAEHFTEMDGNRDGLVSTAEREAAHRKHSAQRR